MSSEYTEQQDNEAIKGYEDPEWPLHRVRSTFVDFFTQNHGHTYWPSSACVPQDDPTLLFTNAGMNQFKALFLDEKFSKGTSYPNPATSKLKRAVNCQKCIRAGGKHNDLDDVGKDVYHHTFFEMLGNWSFGDYFKVEAIDMAWKCLTEVYKLDKSRLYVTYFAGNDSAPCDDEARRIWLGYLPPDRVLPFGAKENFWEMGSTGPCGPCTEIHYDRIGGRDASELVNADNPDVIEIWNNVFIQYNREEGGSLRSLPSQHVDTGMGLERLTSILQGKSSNYDTDAFVPLFAAISKVTGAAPYSYKIGLSDEGIKDTSYRIVADHVRMLCFSIADGAILSNKGRGQVLRRVLRRAVLYGRENLGAKTGFLAKLVPAVTGAMGGTYPELVERQARVMAIINEEEELFAKTMDKGRRVFHKLVDEVGDDKVFSGADAFFLSASVGFPLELTEVLAAGMGLTVDLDGFEEKKREEKEKSEAARRAKMKI